jgi:hypothetical protein
MRRALSHGTSRPSAKMVAPKTATNAAIETKTIIETAGLEAGLWQ